MISLVLPSSTYSESYVAAVREFHADGNKHAEYYGELDPDSLKDPAVFQLFVARLQKQRDGIDLPEGYVPATEFWIITEDGEYAGRLHIRHVLNDYLRDFGGHIGYNVRPSLRGKGIGTEALRLGLQEARKLGLQNVLITCDDDNIASKKIIEKNGGVLENKIPNGIIEKCRYWVKI